MSPIHIKSFVRRFLLPIFLTGYFASVVSAELNSVQITDQTLKAVDSCLKWKIIGSCTWLHCDLFGCRVRVSLKIGHYRPDLVVSVYPTIESHPWKEVKTVVKTAFDRIKNTLRPDLRGVIEGNALEPGHSSKHLSRNLRFFESDVIGHPLPDLPASYANYFCTSQTIPLVPYYSSLLDIIAWRNPEFESLNLINSNPGNREIGRWPLFTWGSVYPRCGWTNQPSPPKAAAVIAQRAGDIAINGGLLRVRTPIGRSAGHQKRWGPPALRETNGSTGKWQMIHPSKQSSCQAFGSNDLFSISDWGGGKVDKKNAYLWVLWRPYKCCARRGQVFLGSDDVHGYP